MNQFVFLNLGLVEANENYLSGLLPIKIISFVLSMILSYLAIAKVESTSLTVFRIRLVIHSLLLKSQPFLLLDPIVYEEYFFASQLTYSIFYSMLFFFWMSELQTQVFHVMSSHKTLEDQENMRVPTLISKLLSIVNLCLLDV